MDFDFEKPLQPLRDKIDALVAKSRRGDPTAEAALACKPGLILILVPGKEMGHSSASVRLLPLYWVVVIPWVFLNRYEK